MERHVWDSGKRKNNRKLRELLSELTWLGITLLQSRVYLFTLTLLDSSRKFLQRCQVQLWKNNMQTPKQEETLLLF